MLLKIVGSVSRCGQTRRALANTSSGNRGYEFGGQAISLIDTIWEESRQCSVRSGSWGSTR